MAVVELQALFEAGCARWGIEAVPLRPFPDPCPDWRLALVLVGGHPDVRSRVGYAWLLPEGDYELGRRFFASQRPASCPNWFEGSQCRMVVGADGVSFEDARSTNGTRLVPASEVGNPSWGLGPELFDRWRVTETAAASQFDLLVTHSTLVELMVVLRPPAG